MIRQTAFYTDVGIIDTCIYVHKPSTPTLVIKTHIPIHTCPAAPEISVECGIMQSQSKPYSKREINIRADLGHSANRWMSVDVGNLHFQNKNDTSVDWICQGLLLAQRFG